VSVKSEDPPLDEQPPEPFVTVESQDPSIGVDEWVARSTQRRESGPGLRGTAQLLAQRVGWWQRLAIAALAGAAVPLLTVNDFQLQIGINALLLAMLALGLNISVGWAGLLDLGYIAFYGFGAYAFALLSSDQLSTSGIHLAAAVSIPIVLVAAACLGLLVGLPSRRLSGESRCSSARRLWSSRTTWPRPSSAVPTASPRSIRSTGSAPRSRPTAATSICC
jgi:hypothetical protein